MIGIVALAAAVFVAAFAISTYEAWWTIVFVVVAVIVLGIERSSLRRRAGMRTGAGLLGSIVLGAAGGWMLLLAQFGKARPCDDCFDNGVLLLPGIVALVVAILVAAVCLRNLSRGLPSTSKSP